MDKRCPACGIFESDLGALHKAKCPILLAGSSEDRTTKLQEENKALKAENERLQAACDQFQKASAISLNDADNLDADVGRLKAEVERLRKALDNWIAIGKGRGEENDRLRIALQSTKEK